MFGASNFAIAALLVLAYTSPAYNTSWEGKRIWIRLIEIIQILIVIVVLVHFWYGFQRKSLKMITMAAFSCLLVVISLLLMGGLLVASHLDRLETPTDTLVLGVATLNPGLFSFLLFVTCLQSLSTTMSQKSKDEVREYHRGGRPQNTSGGFFLNSMLEFYSKDGMF